MCSFRVYRFIYSGGPTCVRIFYVMEDMKTLWVDKYAPASLDDYVLDPGIKDYFKAMVAKNAPQNCLFAGVQCK